jgi:hypothetical protein
MGDLIEVQAEGAEQEEAPNLGLFFKGAGALRFHADAEPQLPGSCQTVAVADRFGVAVFSDLRGGRPRRGGRRRRRRGSGRRGGGA